MSEDLAAGIIKRWDKLKGNRGTWESHWEDVAKRVLPRYRDQFFSNTNQVAKGEKKTEDMFDSTASIALTRFAAIMESMLTPRNQKWHHLRPTNKDLAKLHNVKLYYEEVNNILFQQRYSPKANFASQLHEVYMTLGAFGTGGLFVDAHDKGGLRYKAVNLAELIFDMNHQGIVDSSYRRFSQTTRQIMQQVEVGRYKNVPDQIKSTLKEDPDREWEVIHCIVPNKEQDPNRLDHRGMPYKSIHVLVEHKQVVSESGYHTFRYGVSRYITGPNEIYGRSPAMSVLPSIKVINEQKKTLLKQGQRTVDPVLLTHDDGVLDGFSLRSGAINAGAVNAQGQRLVHELPTGNIAAGQELMDMERQTINDAFLVSLFQLLIDSPQKTATEVLTLAQERGMLVGPMMGRQQSELLATTVEAEVDILARQGLLPPMPQELIEAQGEFELEYDSPLSRAQKAEEAAGYMRTMEAVTNLVSVTGDPAPFDNFNMDVIVPSIAEINAVPPSWMNSEDTMNKIRASRQQAAAEQQAIEAAPAAVGMMKEMQ